MGCLEVVIQPYKVGMYRHITTLAIASNKPNLRHMLSP